MSEHEAGSGRAIRGTIRRRLLVNAVVDPEEAARRLPAGVRPHVSEGGTVVRATITPTTAAVPCEPIGGTCLSATLGLSPDHRGMLAARMEPEHRRAQRVEIDQLDSAFLAGFTTARPAPSYLMRDVAVTWTAVDVHGPACTKVLA
ncbi:MAG: hypothetical protein ACR2HM_02065 [Acidimicrobiales bacterium]